MLLTNRDITMPTDRQNTREATKCYNIMSRINNERTCFRSKSVTFAADIHDWRWINAFKMTWRVTAVLRGTRQQWHGRYRHHCVVLYVLSLIYVSIAAQQALLSIPLRAVRLTCRPIAQVSATTNPVGLLASTTGKQPTITVSDVKVRAWTWQFPSTNGWFAVHKYWIPVPRWKSDRQSLGLFGGSD